MIVTIKLSEQILPYTNPTDIGPGQKAPFELILSSASIPITQINQHNLVVSYQ